MMMMMMMMMMKEFVSSYYVIIDYCSSLLAGIPKLLATTWPREEISGAIWSV